MEVDEEGSLLHGPSKTEHPSLTRLPSSYAPHATFSLPPQKQYQQQYADMYFLRHAKLRSSATLSATTAWSSFTLGSSTAQRVQRVLDVRQGELCWVTGTVYVDLPLKPDILEDIGRDHWVVALMPRRYRREDGEEEEISYMLEDESGRVKLVDGGGGRLGEEGLVTGCVISVLGTENRDGEFEVLDVCVPDLAPQPERWNGAPPTPVKLESGRGAKKVKTSDSDTDTPAPSTSSKIAIVSGLGITSSPTLQLALLQEYLLGLSLSPTSQSHASTISRLIIVGNSLNLNPESVTAPSSSTDGKSKPKRNQKKYGYDAASYNPAPVNILDDFLASLLESMPVTLLPGEADPANASLPQQKIHPAMFPQSRAYSAPPGEEKEAGWFDAVTNPWEGEVEGWRVLATGGQNVDDVYKYLDSERRVDMMENLLRWRCVAPTAPDTLWSYPFQDDDPFVITASPHLFIVGNQPKFETKVIEGLNGELVRLLAVPRFDESGEVVLVDSETLEVERVRIAVA